MERHGGDSTYLREHELSDLPGRLWTMELLLGLAGLALGIVLGWFAARARSDQGTKDAIAAAGRAAAARTAAEARRAEQLRGCQTQLQQERGQEADRRAPQNTD